MGVLLRVNRAAMVRWGSCLVPHLLASLAMLLPAVVAGPALPDYPIPGERPPILMKDYFGQVDLLKCAYDPPTEFDQPYLLERLYGRHFDVSDLSGRGGIVVLGAHNSGTSMVTRLIMLMGAFAGNYETISIHRHNKLKYYEPFSVSLFHDAFLGKFVDTRFRPYHGQSLNFSTMTQEDQDNLDCFAAKHMKDMQRHPPWVMKDPRMALVMPLWQQHLTDLVCVFVHKDPVKNSLSLAANGKKSSHTGDTDMMTPQRWLHLWEETMRNGLEGCKGSPTFFFDSKMIISEVNESIATLKIWLERAGVVGLNTPDADEVDAQIRSYIRTGERQYSVNPLTKLRLNITDHPEVDTTPPEPNSQQLALEEAIQTHLRKQESGEPINLMHVADDVLQLSVAIAQELDRRAQEARKMGFPPR